MSTITEEWAVIWKEGTDFPAEEAMIHQILAAADGEADLPRLTPADIKLASATFAEATSDSADGFLPRHFGWLTDELLSCWAEMLAPIEDFGVSPIRWHVSWCP